MHKHKPGLPVFHNGGHIRRGRRDLAHCNTHLELESLPTGGWGYDHFPLSARYAQTIGMDYLGMTGKFHTSWGEFGGFKHPNALRYETALSIANGARCSIGDQLHPEGLMDEATYALIGAAYGEVEAKEPWCRGVTAAADVALLTIEALHPGQDEESWQPAGQIRYRRRAHAARRQVSVRRRRPRSGLRRVQGADLAGPCPDRRAAAGQDRPFSEGRRQAPRLRRIRAQGGRRRVRLEARRLVRRPVADQAEYFRPEFPVAGLPAASYVMYADAYAIALADGGKPLGAREESYFNRDAFAFCSHQHTPSTGQAAGPA